MVELEPSKLATRVRFPSPAPFDARGLPSRRPFFIGDDTSSPLGCEYPISQPTRFPGVLKRIRPSEHTVRCLMERSVQIENPRDAKSQQEGTRDADEKRAPNDVEGAFPYKGLLVPHVLPSCHAVDSVVLDNPVSLLLPHHGNLGILLLRQALIPDAQRPSSRAYLPLIAEETLSSSKKSSK